VVQEATPHGLDWAGRRNRAKAVGTPVVFLALHGPQWRPARPPLTMRQPSSSPTLGGCANSWGSEGFSISRSTVQLGCLDECRSHGRRRARMAHATSSATIWPTTRSEARTACCSPLRQVRPSSRRRTTSLGQGQAGRWEARSPPPRPQAYRRCHGRLSVLTGQVGESLWRHGLIDQTREGRVSAVEAPGSP
jgi:hypothetical protein